VRPEHAPSLLVPLEQAVGRARWKQGWVEAVTADQVRSDHITTHHDVETIGPTLSCSPLSRPSSRFLLTSPIPIYPMEAGVGRGRHRRPGPLQPHHHTNHTTRQIMDTRGFPRARPKLFPSLAALAHGPPSHLQVTVRGPGGARESVGFDHLILATGSAYAPPIKAPVGSQLRLDERLQALHEGARALQVAPSVVVVGGGLVGVELAAEIVTHYPGEATGLDWRFRGHDGA
jgi:hypothetical protein